MRPWMDRAMLRGRIHGRLMLVLVAVVVLASAAAIWQFSALLDDHDPDFADNGRSETAPAPEPTEEPDSPTSSPSATPSPTLESSPAEEETTSVPATANASDAPTEAADGPACTASLTLDSEWSESVSVTVTVANSGADRIEGWEVQLALEHAVVTATWGLDHIEGDRYGDILFNGAMDPGGSVAPSFQADVEADFALPASVPCVPA